jgi:hypothetical protein
MNRVYELGEAKIANMEFHTTIKNKLFTYETYLLIVPVKPSAVPR